MVPLVEVLADDRLEGAHDFLGEEAAGLRLAQGAAIVGDFREDAGVVTLGTVEDIDREQDATGGAGEFSGGEGGLKAMIKEHDWNGGAGGRAIDEQSDGGAGLELAEDFQECKRVAPDDDGFDAPPASRVAAEFGEPGAGFFHGDGQQPDAVLGEKRGAEFPVAEVGGNEEDTAIGREGGEEVVAAFELADVMLDGTAGFVSEEVGDLEAEVAKQAAGGTAGGGLVVMECGEEVFDNDPEAAGSEPAKE
jgi:hypothetical protein